MSEVKTQSLKIEKTARFVTFGNPNTAKHLIVALHGYGQLSRYFIQKFIDLSDDYYIIAPEGIHRFYLNETSGRVGASWMTKEAREEDIADNLKYIDQLLAETSTYHFEKKIILGFSQGGATAARYYYLGKHAMDHLIIWASIFPPDLEISKEINVKSQSATNYFVVGNQDEYFSDESRSEIIAYFQKMNYSTVEYSGSHAIDPAILNGILKVIQ